MKRFLMNILLVFVFTSTIHASNTAKSVPLDSAIRYGVLENGLTYYIRHNEKPEQRASFYLVQNVGAILENDNQNGLAHFLEHMAFNGLAHFKGKSMLEYLEKNGVSFGRDINAYTTTEETVYNISNVPVSNPNLIDSTLLVLYDWCDNLLLENSEIDAERGVIAEEWRTRRNARFRMNNMELNHLYFDSKYSRRDVIGDLEVIKNFDYQTIKDFYHDWYRTDLQAVIVVGDIDVDKIEKTIKEKFSKIKSVKNPKERKTYEIPDNNKPRYALITDKEATFSNVKLVFKHDPIGAENTGNTFLRQMYVRNLFTNMLGNRLNEPLHTEKPPYMGAMAYIYQKFRAKEDYTLYIVHAEGKALKATKTAVQIVEQAKRFGFTETEFERAKTNLLNQFDDAYKKREEIDNDSYAKEYRNHYLTGEPAPGIEYEFKYLKEILPQLTLEEINAVAQKYLTDTNMLIAVSGPEKEGLIHPTKEEILAVINNIKNSEIEPYDDSFSGSSLISELPTKGKILERKPIEKLGAEEITLSNGIKVFVKQSDLDKESVIINAHSWGGRSVLPQKQLINAKFFGDFIGSYGVADFSSMDLQKLLTGKNASANFSIGDLTETISGHASTKDLETMFQLIYLKFTAPRFDKKMYNSVYSRLESYAQSYGNDVDRVFKDSVKLIMNNYHPRVHIMKKELLDELSFDGIKQIYQERFGNPGDFTFVISGDFEQKQLDSLLETYIASLPVKEGKEKYIDHKIKPPKKDVVNHFELPMDTKKSTVYVNLHKEYTYSVEDEIYLYVISRLLSKRYLDEIREKEGGTYGVGVSSSFKDYPYDELRLRFAFDCDPEKAEKLKTIALAEIDKLLDGIINEEDLEEIKQNINKSGEERLNNLGYWHGKLSDYAIEGEMPILRDEIESLVKQMTPKAVTKKANKLLKRTKRVEVVMSAK